VPAEAWLPLAAAELCLLFALSLGRRWERSRAAHSASWAFALACACLGAGALSYGTAFGWSSAVLRCYYLGGALLTVPWLAVGQVQLLVGARVARGVAGAVAVLSVVAGVLVLTADVHLRFDPGGGSHPVPAVASTGTAVRVTVALANTSVLVLLGGLAVSLVRQRRLGTAASRARSTGLALVAAGALVAGGGGLVSALGRAGANGVAVLVGFSLVYAGSAKAGTRVGRHAAAPLHQREAVRS